MGRELGTESGDVCDVLSCDLLFCGGVERGMGVLDFNCAMRNVGDQEVAERTLLKAINDRQPWRALLTSASL